ncbi:MAG: hypothetical protein GX891_00845, partial [Clostridiales bacterium]|nr:hypothetical protein [Clostridiales bacterium]
MERKQYIENNDFETELKNYIGKYEKLGYELVPAEKSVGRITYEPIFATYCDP